MTDTPRGDEETTVEPKRATQKPVDRAADVPAQPMDPNDEIPVPIVMSPAEVEQRADVVETLREEEGIPAPPDQAADKQP
jgi:hypothetical protein